MIMMVREHDLADTLRRPIGKSEARQVLDHIGEWDGSASDQWKIRAAAQQKKLDDGNPFALAEVYKTLAVRQEMDKLSAADRRQLKHSQTCLSEELAAALDEPLGKIQVCMEEAALD
jgi:RNA polymerase-interacting CarD/CdnL/TRCF family regulator